MGDDLASDDEYLFDAGLIDASGGRGTSILSDGEDDDDKSLKSLKKRKGVSTTTDDADSSTLSSTSKQRKKNKKDTPTNSKNVLIHAGRGIALDSVDAQSMFLSTLYSHSIKLSEGTNNSNETTTSAAQGENNDSEDAANTTNSAGELSFSFQPHLYSTPSSTNEKTRLFNHTNLASFIKSGPLPSNKRLKNWKHAQSPMILIITLSARRSVELMKQLSTFKLPVCKLFAKHMNLDEQVELLRGVGGIGGKNGVGSEESHNQKHNGKKKKCYSLAVGTPSRLLKLLLHGTTNDPNNSDGGGALRLNHTELVIIDCHEDSKGWNVCTLRDTSSDLIEFLKMGVIPQCEARKGKIKLALF